MPVLLLNASRPLLPPALVPIALEKSCWTQPHDALYFNNRRDLRKSYTDAVEILAKENPETIGLIMGDDGWEYPLWALLHTRLARMPQIRHVAPPQTANGLPSVPDGFTPHYLIVLWQALPWDQHNAPDDTPVRIFKRVNGVYELLE